MKKKNEKHIIKLEGFQLITFFMKLTNIRRIITVESIRANLQNKRAIRSLCRFVWWR